jgi:D-isomer specific 2-hydroxyacid dehydrogenase, NAD binding domain
VRPQQRRRQKNTPGRKHHEDRARQPSRVFAIVQGNRVDEAALAVALREERVAGAAMDVGRALDQMATPELAKFPNVIAIPHIGGLIPHRSNTSRPKRFASSRRSSPARLRSAPSTPITGRAVLEQ